MENINFFDRYSLVLSLLALWYSWWWLISSLTLFRFLPQFRVLHKSCSNAVRLCVNSEWLQVYYLTQIAVFGTCSTNVLVCDTSNYPSSFLCSSELLGIKLNLSFLYFLAIIWYFLQICDQTCLLCCQWMLYSKMCLVSYINKSECCV